MNACAVLDLPGGVSLLMLPPPPLGDLPEGLTELLALACRAAAGRGRRFAQIMFEPDTADRVRAVLPAAGFSHLALLQYMQRSAYDPVPIRPVEGTNWLTLVDTNEDSFAEVIRRTYVDSRDCPGLTGIRTMQGRDRQPSRGRRVRPARLVPAATPWRAGRSADHGANALPRQP